MFGSYSLHEIYHYAIKLGRLLFQWNDDLVESL